jgi:hypothetical protein
MDGGGLREVMGRNLEPESAPSENVGVENNTLDHFSLYFPCCISVSLFPGLFWFG